MTSRHLREESPRSLIQNKLNGVAWRVGEWSPFQTVAKQLDGLAARGFLRRQGVAEFSVNVAGTRKKVSLPASD